MEVNEYKNEIWRWNCGYLRAIGSFCSSGGDLGHCVGGIVGI